MNKLEDIIEEIKNMEKELLIEIQRKEKEFFYKIKGKRVYFEEKTEKIHKTKATKIFKYLHDSSFATLLTVPVIWSCIIPALVVDATVSLFQFLCFPVYNIPKVNRSDYVIFDRQSLDYLNPIEKMNCTYCAYFNGLVAYLQEVVARTEQYWCPIKHARRLHAIHNRYYKFFDYGDHQSYSDKLEILRRDFSDLTDKKL